MTKKKKKTDSNLANNRRARHDYVIEDIYEAGISLVGPEVKSIRQGKVSIKEAFCSIDGGEVYIEDMHVSPYDQGSYANVDPMRKRKLLLHKGEIRRLEKERQQEGYTLIPLRVYLSRGRIKVEIATAKGKKLYDKRRDIAEKDAKRRMAQALKR
ncbi:MAG: SsrA-binding protein SmpB [Tissierellia bacterium]|nr:SsrA-binding protein SmpB [Tissierellia bacterium]